MDHILNHILHTVMNAGENDSSKPVDKWVHFRLMLATRSGLRASIRYAQADA